MGQWHRSVQVGRSSLPLPGDNQPISRQEPNYRVVQEHRADAEEGQQEEQELTEPSTTSGTLLSVGKWAAKMPFPVRRPAALPHRQTFEFWRLRTIGGGKNRKTTCLMARVNIRHLVPRDETPEAMVPIEFGKPAFVDLITAAMARRFKIGGHGLSSSRMERSGMGQRPRSRLLPGKAPNRSLSSLLSIVPSSVGVFNIILSD